MSLIRGLAVLTFFILFIFFTFFFSTMKCLSDRELYEFIIIWLFNFRSFFGFLSGLDFSFSITLWLFSWISFIFKIFFWFNFLFGFFLLSWSVSFNLNAAKTLIFATFFDLIFSFFNLQTWLKLRELFCCKIKLK